MSRRVAITGAAGQLGRELVRAFQETGDEVLALGRPEFDITRSTDLRRMSVWSPEIVVNAAAWTDVDGCAREPERAMQVNGYAAGAVAAAAAVAGALIVQISSNEVFDGSRDRPYTEIDAANPINPYGASKLAGERLVAGRNARHLIVRTAWLFGPGGRNFVTKLQSAADRAQLQSVPLRVVSDEWGNPTWAPWLAEVIATSATAQPPGVLHLAGEPPATRMDWARVILDSRSIRLEPISIDEYVRPSRVPPRAVLSTSLAASRGITPASWLEATKSVMNQAGMA